MLSAFKSYLTEKALTQEKYVPYYVQWVSRSYSFLDKPESSRLSADERERYLTDLAGENEQWQVNQADDALRMYDFFLSRDHRSDWDKTTNGNTAWAGLETRTRAALRARQRSLTTERTYLSWFRRFREFLGSKDLAEIDGADIQRFLSYLAVERRIAASTQNQALNALVFIYRHALDKTLGENELKAVRARQKRRLPVVLSDGEVKAVFTNLSGTPRLMAMLTYGCGLRLQECTRLRIKDIDIERNMVIVRSGKGDKDRRTVLPESLENDLVRHISEIRALYDQDRENMVPGVYPGVAGASEHPDDHDLHPRR